MSKKSFIRSSLFVSALMCVAHSSAQATPTLTVLTHDSFALDKKLLADFETKNLVKLRLVKGGDAAQMVNKLILSGGNIADVVYGFDNILLPRAQKAGVLENSSVRWVDFGYVALNFERAAFKGKKLPGSLEELTQPTFKDTLVLENPATSSPGLAFLLATVKHFGEPKVWQWWADLKHNGMKVTQGWTEAYETQFSRNGGRYSLVLSYSSSPAAEVFYADKKLEQSPTANLFLKGSVFKQLEGIALVKNTPNAALGRKFIEFMRSGAVQKDIPTQMFVYPIVSGTPLDPVYKFSTVPQSFFSPQPSDPLVLNSSELVRKWTDVVIKGKNPAEVR